MIKISKRLEAMSSLVSNNSKVIDVGCDHGLLDIYLYQQNISTKIIASDINENAFQGCSGLNNITLSTTLVNINSYAFD